MTFTLIMLDCGVCLPFKERNEMTSKKSKVNEQTLRLFPKKKATKTYIRVFTTFMTLKKMSNASEKLLSKLLTFLCKSVDLSFPSFLSFFKINSLLSKNLYSSLTNDLAFLQSRDIEVVCETVTNFELKIVVEKRKIDARLSFSFPLTN